MKNLLFSGLSSLLLPLGAYAGPTSGASYQRTYLSSTINASSTDLSRTHSALPRDLVDLSGNQLDIQVAHPVRELVIVDEGITEADKSLLRRELKPGAEMVQIKSDSAGLPQLIAALEGHKNLAAIHIVSHAEAGVILLGNSRITAENIQQEVHAFAALHNAVREGGDLLFYGCDLAANEAGEELLDIISNKTGLDVAASNNLTGSHELHGDWELEVKRGNIESGLAFSEKALKDFSSVLAPAANGTYNFSGWTGVAQLSTTHFTLAAKSGDGVTQNLGNDIGSFAYMLNGGGNTNHYFYLRADGTNTTAFELTGLAGGEAAGYSGEFTNLRVVGYLQSGGTVTSSTVNGSAGNQTFTFSGGQLASFSGVKLKGFKLFFDCAGACNGALDGPEFFEFSNFTIANAINTPPPPTVTHGNISISGASGTSGAYKIGDTVTATWNNTGAGDNNSITVTGVTVNFSQFGGGAAVAASNSSGTWTATYTITAGAIDITARNVSVTATNSGGSTTTADQTNATVDSIAPTVTDGRISISGASGTSGAYKIGDTVTATWNNTAGGDNNSDTISSTKIDFSQFGGGSAVTATNSSGTWTATYTIVAGSTDLTNRNVAVTATDNAGNTTTTTDSTNATVDNIAPSVSSVAVSGSPASTDTSMAFTASFNESVSNISTDDFTLVGTGSATGTIASVSAASGSSANVNISSISGNGTLKVNLNGGTNIVDHVGNSIAAYSSGSTHTVAIPTAPGAPTIGTATAGDSQVSVTFTAPGSNGGSAITVYTATASPSGAFGSCAGPAACTATVTGLTNGTAYTFTVTATNAIGTSTASGASNSATPKGVQTITFASPGAQNFGTAPTLTATATSSLTPTFSSSTTGVCTITTGGLLTFVAAGSCTIDADQAGNTASDADQAGNTAWNPATTVSRTFTVNAVVPSAPTVGTATAGDTQATVTFSAPASTGGSAIIASGYTVTASPGGATGTGSSSPITVTGLTNGVAYTFTVTATNSAGTGSASAASNSVTPASPQTITFTNPGTMNFGTTPTLGATSDSSLTVSFTSSTTGVCTITTGGTLTFVTTGTCTINANQAGNGSFLAASQVSRSFTVNAIIPGAPTAATATAGDTQASIAFTAPTSTGGATITGYTVTSNPGGITGTGASSPIIVTGLTNGIAYTFTVTATNSAGTGSASAASNSITPAAGQTITFASPGAQNFGTTPTLTATADSGLTPVFTSSTTAVCTITTGGALTFVTAGTCTINADQAGNGSYLPAAQVSRGFTVNGVIPGAPIIGAASAGSASASVSFNAPASTGGVALTGYTVTASPGGATATGTGSPLTVTGLTNGTAYTFTVRASNAIGSGSPSAASNSVTPKASQTISFTNPGAQIVGATVTLSASASSGATPSFSSSTPSVCTVTGNLAKLLTVGTCTIVAEDAGSSSFSSASATESFAVKAEPNKIPVITQGSSVSITVAEDTKIAFSLSATDGNSEPLSWTIKTQPLQGVADVGITGGTSYTPVANYAGNDSFVVAVSDGKDTVTATVNVIVTPVNDAPTITGLPATSANSDEAYSFAPIGNDPDKGDTLTYSIANKPAWASFNTATGALTGTPAQTDAGNITRDVVISVTDGTQKASLPAFNIKVVSTNPALPVLKVPSDLSINATALYTPVGLRQLLGLSATTSQADLDKALSALAVDTKGESCCTTLPEGLVGDQVLLLKPGVNVVRWTAKNTIGLSNSGVQLVNVKPLVSLSKSQIAVRGSHVDFKVILNGQSPSYPLTIGYVLDSATTATAAEHSLTSGSVTFTEGQLEATVPVALEPVSGFSDSQIIVRLASDVNAGAANSHTISLREGNVPPIVSLSLTQGGFPTTLVTPAGGSVTVTAHVVDPNVKDTHTFDWSATSGLADTDSSATDASRVFNPSGLTGSQQIQVAITDSAGAVVQAQMYFRVLAELPLLKADVDTDKDGLADQLEGIGDSDSNGIPDYLDNMPSPNILPQQVSVANSYLVECDPGVRCGLGLFALGSKSGGVQILDNEIGSLPNFKADGGFTPVGGIFDFVIRDLPIAGQSTRVVIPQVVAVPVNAVYRKFQKGQWVNFVVDQNNAIHSALGNAGHCPPPGAEDWKTGLVAGSLCVQLTIQDGGANDDDGKVNSAIADPGAVSAPVVVPPVVPPVEPPPTKKKGGAIDLLMCLFMLGGLLAARFKTSAARLKTRAALIRTR